MSLSKFFNHDFDKGDFKLYNKNGNKVYREYSDGYYNKTEYNENGDIIYYENLIDGVLIDNKNIFLLRYKFVFSDGSVMKCSSNHKLRIVDGNSCLNSDIYCIETLLMAPYDVSVGDHIVCDRGFGIKKVKYILTNKK